MNRIKGFGPLIAVAALGLLVAILAEPVSKWLASSHSGQGRRVLGKVVLTEGSVRHLHDGDSDLLPAPVSHPVDLSDGDRLQTGAKSRAVVSLASGDEFEIHADSAVEFQLWNPKDSNSPIYVTLLSGEPTLRTAGVRGKAYVVKDGRLYLPGQAPKHKPMALTVLRNAPLDLHLAETDETIPSEDQSGGTAGNEPVAEDTAAQPVAAPDTLSNEYIDETISGQQGLFSKCWLTHLKDAPKAKGQITVQFEITRHGKVRDARVADASLNDEPLKKCVVSVFERIQFRPYKGSEISLSYPINFE